MPRIYCLNFLQAYRIDTSGGNEPENDGQRLAFRSRSISTQWQTTEAEGARALDKAPSETIKEANPYKQTSNLLQAPLKPFQTSPFGEKHPKDPGQKPASRIHTPWILETEGTKALDKPGAETTKKAQGSNNGRVKKGRASRARKGKAKEGQAQEERSLNRD